MSQKKNITPKRTQKLLEFINKNLTPRIKKEKNLGRFYSGFVNEMLDKLPKEYGLNKDYNG